MTYSKNKYFILSFDLEKSRNKKNSDSNYSPEGLINLIDILNKYGIKSTFFTTYFFAKHNPDIIFELIKNGHEIACHGYDHDDNFRTMDDNMVFTRIKKSKDFLEEKFKIRVKGFRSPRFQKISNNILRKLGFAYNSSVHPTWVPGRYFDMLKSRKIKNEKPIYVPISVSPLLRLPFGWFWFKHLPLAYTKMCITSCYFFDKHILTYFHSWEFDSGKKNYKIFEKKFVILIEYLLRQKKAKPTTIEILLEKNKI